MSGDSRWLFSSLFPCLKLGVQESRALAETRGEVHRLRGRTGQRMSLLDLLSITARGQNLQPG